MENRWEAGVLAAPDPYWLCRCEGWHVYTSDGCVGRVARVLYGSSINLPDAFLIESGLLRKRLTRAAVDQVASAEPGERRIVLTRIADAPGAGHRAPAS